jgi:WD repeat-containing protein 48
VENCCDISDGECIVLCNDSMDSSKPSCEGINKIVVMDDHLLWTASGTSTIRRWDIPQRRSLRTPQDSDGERFPLPKPRRATLTVDVPSDSRPRSMSFSPSVQSLESEYGRETKLNGLPYDSLVKLVSPNDPFNSYAANRTRDSEVATLYSAASVMSVPHQIIRPLDQSIIRTSNPIQSSRTEETVMLSNTARMKYDQRELAADAVPFCSKPDDVILGDHGLVRCVILSDRINALTVDTAGEVAVWDIVRGTCQGRYLPEEVAAASLAGSSAGGSDERERGPREALEIVRERIEGEAVVSTWCTADTKAGVLTIHMNERCFEAEVYADEVGFADDAHFNEESKSELITITIINNLSSFLTIVNIGKWVLRNLFIGFILEEQRRHSQDGGSQLSLSRAPSLNTNTPNRLLSSADSPKALAGNSCTVVSSSNMIPAVAPNVSPTARSSPLLTPLIPLHYPWRDAPSGFSSIPQSPMPLDITPTSTSVANQRTHDGPASSVPTPNVPKDDYFVARTRLQSMQGIPSDDFSGWSGPIRPEPPTPSTPSGIMGRLKNFGKLTKKPANDVVNISTPESTTAVVGTPAPPSVSLI